MLGKSLPWMAHSSLILGIIFSLFAYFFGLEGFIFYGSWAHLVSRSHPLFVHLSVGAVIVLCGLELSRKIAGQARGRLHHLCHFLLAPTIITGLLMEAAERYPNPSITTHLIWALAAYILFFCFSLSVWTGARTTRFVAAGALALVLVQAARVGGTLYKGQGYFPW